MAMRRGCLALLTLLLWSCGLTATPTAPPPIFAPQVPGSTAQAGITAPAPSGTSPAPSAVPQNVTTFPDASRYRWAPVVSGFNHPLDVEFPQDGTGRMFVVEQVGRIREFENGQLRPSPFLDITDRIGSDSSERGLLGLAFHPHFKDNGLFYVNYTDVNGNTVIARFQAGGDSADPASEKDLIHVTQPFANHNGGEMAFGPDGYLYIGLGDGGSQGDPFGNGQNKDTLLGKILRIDVDHGDPYAIPADNPFVNGGGRAEIWAYGLRNPWRFSFDRASGDVYIADVGQNLWEEIDVESSKLAGLNYGWNYFEGLHPYQGQPPSGVQFTAPVVNYNHSVGGCAVTGGYVYRGALPEWQGVYLYGDYCTGYVWGLLHTASGWGSQMLFQTGANISSFGQDAAGEIYLVGYANGVIYRLSQ
jgi:glucose/arabinose dehydrogenase